MKTVLSCLFALCLITSAKSQNWTDWEKDYAKDGTLAFYSRVGQTVSANGIHRHWWECQYNPDLDGWVSVTDVECNGSSVQGWVKLGTDAGQTTQYKFWFDDDEDTGHWTWSFVVHE